MRTYILNMKKNIIAFCLGVLCCVSYSWAGIPFKISPGTAQIGEARSLDGHKVSVVAFLSSECPCSDSHISELTRLQAMYPQVNFLGIHTSVFSDLAGTKAYYQNKKVNFPVYVDGDLKITNELKAVKTPHIFVFAQDGKLVYQGGVSDSSRFSYHKKNYLAEVLAAVQSGKSSPYSFKRTLGCYIKRDKL